MRIVFLGTPDFAVPALQSLVEKYEVIAVVCQPDKARDRKGHPIYGAVKSEAIKLNLPIYQFEKIRQDGVDVLKELAPDLMITCAYGQILSQEILDIPKYGVLNIHGSLLPDLRGSAPIQWALIDGYDKTGVTIMKTALGMDTGDIVSVKEIAIPDNFYLEDLYNEMKKVGAELLIETIPLYVNGQIVPVPQDESKATKCRMIEKEDAKLDFSLSAQKIRNKIRGIGYGYFFYNGSMIKVFKADVCEDVSMARQIISLDKKGLKIACGEKSLVFTELQVQGKRRMNSVDFSNGNKMIGEVDL